MVSAKKEIVAKNTAAKKKSNAGKSSTKAVARVTFSNQVIGLRRDRAWRWNRIVLLGEGGEKPLKSDDSVIHRGYAFWVENEKLSKIRGKAERAKANEALQREYFDCKVAFEWYKEADFERWAVEALVVAQSDPSYIAEQTGAPQSAVEMYEALFFDVRDRLDRELLVRGSLLAPSLVNGAPENDSDMFWKQIAYEKGGEMVKELWRMPDAISDVTHMLSGIAIGRMVRNAAAAQFVRKVDKHTASDITNEFNAMRAIEKEEAAGSDKMLQHLVSAAAVTVAAVGRAFENAGPKELQQVVGELRRHREVAVGTAHEGKQ